MRDRGTVRDARGMTDRIVEHTRHDRCGQKRHGLSAAFEGYRLPSR